MSVESAITGLTVVWNTKELLERAYTSIRKFHPKLKIIVIDGSDKDNPCCDYIQHLVNTDKFFQAYRVGHNIGHGRGMDAGIRKVTTPYVLFFDSDIIMVKSPLQGMLDLMTDGIFGVGYCEKVGFDGFDYGVHKHHFKEPSVKYLHPMFQLVQVKEYYKYKPYIHHGAPCIATMIDIHNKGLSNKVIKEFPGLGHVGNHDGLSWKRCKGEYIIHDVSNFGGTGRMRIAQGLPHIEGEWEDISKVPDPPKQPPLFSSLRELYKEIELEKRENKLVVNTTLLTCTGDRHLCMSLLKKWIKRQTVAPHQWIIIDDGQEKLSKDFIDNLPSYANYIRRIPKKSDPKHTLNINMELGLANVTGDSVLFCEDDEFYASKYVEVMSDLLKKYLVVGICKSKYYYLPKLCHYTHANTNHASLAQTGVSKEFIPEVIKLLSGNPFIDLRIWAKILGVSRKEFPFTTPTTFNPKGEERGDGKGFLFDDGDDDCLYVGMKGMPGRFGIGCGHQGIGTYDNDIAVLKRWMPEGYAVYMEVYNTFFKFNHEMAKRKNNPETHVRPILDKSDKSQIRLTRQQQILQQKALLRHGALMK